MICSSEDLKAYFLAELDESGKSSVEHHIQACQGCREEFDRLRLTRTALLSLDDEEPPQRIAFVSDKVFAPRWWQTIWGSGPAMGFASAAMLAAAILAHGFARPVSAPVQATLDTAQIERRVEQQVNARLDAAVTKAVGQAEARQAHQIAQTLEAAERRYQSERKADMAVARQKSRYYDQQMSRLLVADNERAGQ